MTTQSAAGRERRPRRDQVRNRGLLLETARETFRERGLDASIEEIARRAGVGATTFYRHFPTKDALIDAIIDDLFDGLREAVRRAQTIDDPWDAFVALVKEGCRMQNDDPAFYDMIASRMSPELTERARALTAEIVGDVVARAQDGGELRREIGVDDVAVLMRMASTASPQWCGDCDSARQDLLVDVLLEGVRAR